MAIQTIDIGSVANDPTADTARTAFDKVNDNFDELDTRVTQAQSDADASVKSINTVEPATDGSVTLTPSDIGAAADADAVKSVNGVEPATDGGVTLTPADIGAPTDAETVKSVNGQTPATDGSVTLEPADIGAPTDAETVKSVNGVTPDTSGDVALDVLDDPGADGIVLRSEHTGGNTEALHYSEGEVTEPTVAFFNTGDLSVSYHSRSASWQRVGARVTVDFSIDFTPTFTTSSGPLWLVVLPLAAANSISAGSLSEFSGNPSTGPSLPSGRSWVTPRTTSGLTVLELIAHGAGTTSSKLVPSNFVSGNRYVISGSITYTV